MMVLPNITSSLRFLKLVHKGRCYDYIFVDINSVSLVKYIRYEHYLVGERINLTPAVYTFQFLIQLKKFLNKECNGKTKVVISFDNGVSSYLKQFGYKDNRAHSTFKNLTLVPIASVEGNAYNDIYRLNVKLLLNFIENCSNMYADIGFGEADFKISYLIQKILKDKPDSLICVITGDSDLVQLLDKQVDVVYVHNRVYEPLTIEDSSIVKQYMSKHYKLEGIDYRNGNYVLVMKVLTGDKTDNIDSLVNVRSARAICSNYQKLLNRKSKLTFDDFKKILVDYFGKGKGKLPKKFNSVEELIDKAYQNWQMVNLRSFQSSLIFNADDIAMLEQLYDNELKIDKVITKDNFNTDAFKKFTQTIGNVLGLQKSELKEIVKTCIA